MSVSRLVGGVAGLPEEAKRRISAIIGAVVADAASLPLEWIYKDDTMTGIVGDKEPEFWLESKCPFYSLPTGNLSCYGDELTTTLASLAASDSNLNLPELQKTLQAKFGAPGSPYQVALAKRADKVYPIAGPWLNGGVIKSLANMDQGLAPPGSAECEDNDGLALALPVFLLCPGQTKDVASLLTTDQMTLEHLAVQTSILANYLGGVEQPVEAALASSSMTERHLRPGINI